MIEIIMPQVGQDVPTATIIEWTKMVGDPVEKGEVVALVESDKAAFELEADRPGILLEVLFQAGEEVEVLKPIAYLGQADERPAPPEKDAVHETPPAPRMTEHEPARPAAPASGRTVASPTARRLAREHGVDLETIEGTGPGGRIIAADVEEAIAAEGATEAPPDTIVPFARIKQRMADRLTMSKTTIPHFYLLIDVDMTEAVGWRETYNRSTEERITFTDLIVKATASALAEFPDMNAHVEKDRVVLKADINIGVATMVEQGLLVPVIPQADRKTVQDISALLKRNTEAAKRGIMEPHIGSFTITSLGMYGIKAFVPIINPPECAILAVGAIEQRVVPIRGGIGVREMLTMALAADHRAADGVRAASFLNKIKDDLENMNVSV